MNTRKDNPRNALAAWKRLKPGHIAKPLRRIGERTNSRDLAGRVIVSWQYVQALRASRRGNGEAVTKMAYVVVYPPILKVVQ